MTPAEVIARFRCSGRRFSGEWPCEVCRGHAEQSVAALTAQGYVIVDADLLTGGIPKDASLWPDDEELADGHFTDRTYAWWKVALGHPRAHSGCCATCGCASSCFLDVFYDAVVMSVARHALAPGTAPQPSGTIQSASEGGGGISGRSDDTNPAGTLSAPQGWTEFTDVHGRHFLRQVADNGDLLIAFRPTPIEEDWKARAEQAEAKLDRLREPHTRGPRTNTCNDCGQDWPCETIQTIDEEKPHA